MKQLCENQNHSAQAQVRAVSLPQRFRAQSGQTILELALLLPVLLVLVFGVLEMGRYMYIDILVGNAAHAAAAYAATHPGDVFASGYGGITTAANNDFENNGEGTMSGVTPNLAVTASLVCGCDSSGSVTQYYSGSSCSTLSQSDIDADCSGSGNWVSTVSVTASGTYQALFQYPFVPTSISISKTAVMRVQQ
jgi:Flp pilus assembly protein TadG